MTDKPTVVPFCGRQAKAPEPNEAALSLIVELIPMAQSGHIHSIAIAFTSADGTATAYSHDGDLPTLIGAVQILNHELLCQATTEDD